MAVDALAYATATEIKASMPGTFNGTTYDALLESLAERASRLVDAFLGHEAHAFDARATATVRYFNATGRGWAYIDPCVAVTSVGVKASESATSFDAWAATEYEAAAGCPWEPRYNLGYYDVLLVAAGSSAVFPVGRKILEVTARWGRCDTIPPVIQQAVIIQAGRWFKRGQAAWSTASGNQELGEVMYTRKIDPDQEMILINSGLARASW